MPNLKAPLVVGAFFCEDASYSVCYLMHTELGDYY